MDAHSHSMMRKINPVTLLAPIVARLYSEIAAILRQTEMERGLAARGVDVVASGPAQFDKLIRAETIKRAKVIKQARIKGE